VRAWGDRGDVIAPGSARSYARSGGGFAYQANSTSSLVPLAPGAAAPAGGDQPHNNLQPYLTFYFCIALQGVYPPRT
jgi:microcystin-dependent protein